MRAAIESLLRSAGLTVLTFASAREFHARAPITGPACLVLDVFLPDGSGLQVQDELARREPAVPVVFISGQGDIAMTVRAMRAGAVEFLPKPFQETELLAAVQRAIEVSRERLQDLSELHFLRELYGSLTPRERAVLDRVVAGLLNKEIAFELGISEVTVKIHRHQVMRKMFARSVPDLVRICDRLNQGTTPGFPLIPSCGVGAVGSPLHYPSK
jgi:FixJ family two-component response regulator